MKWLHRLWLWLWDHPDLRRTTGQVRCCDTLGICREHSLPARFQVRNCHLVEPSKLLFICDLHEHPEGDLYWVSPQEIIYASKPYRLLANPVQRAGALHFRVSE